MNVENAKQQMRKGVLELVILSVLRQNDAYASDIIEKLKSAEIIIVEGTLYPLLTRLKNADYLTYNWVESTEGPPRKYYRLTYEGEVLLAELTQSWTGLVKSINNIINTPPNE